MEQFLEFQKILNICDDIKTWYDNGIICIFNLLLNKIVWSFRYIEAEIITVIKAMNV